MSMNNNIPVHCALGTQENSKLSKKVPKLVDMKAANNCCSANSHV
jgi:hypothetical protein